MRPLPEHRIGTVRTVGTNSRFVLVEIVNADLAADFPDGQELRCVRTAVGMNGQTAILRISRERRPPFLVADVLSGEPRTGDEVYFSKATSATVSPSPTPPITSFLVPASLFPSPAPAPHGTP